MLPGSRMPWKCTAIILLALAGLACSKQSEEAPSDAEWPKHGLSEEQANEVLVKVGDRTITVGELADRLASQSPYLQARFESPERRKEFLDNLVRYELLVYEAKRRGYADDPEVVSARRNIMIQELIKQEVDQPLAGKEISDEEVQAAYDANPKEFDRPAQVRASHIFIKDRAKAAGVLQKAKAGDRTAFTKLARDESEDETTKADRPSRWSVAPKRRPNPWGRRRGPRRPCGRRFERPRSPSTRLEPSTLSSSPMVAATTS